MLLFLFYTLHNIGTIDDTLHRYNNIIGNINPKKDFHLSREFSSERFVIRKSAWELSELLEVRTRELNQI